MKPIGPIYTTQLFLPLSKELLGVLKSLTPEDWVKPTVCLPWTVKEVAAHLLGGNFGRLWNRTESSPAPILLYDELLEQINEDNALWVKASRRISPHIIIELIELTDRLLARHFQSLDLHGSAEITVAWASDQIPPNWFDIAREYTEKWLHQQHIRQAVGRPLMMESVWLAPVLDTFIRGLLRTFGNTDAILGTSIGVQIVGEAGGEWALVRGESGWELFVGHPLHPVSQVKIDQSVAWRLFTRSLDPNTARHQVEILGNKTLGYKVLETVSIMA
ncbi:maleylpyruvate isomerase N-terminal domain-containing protein [Dehalogenimonas alkenigignens]|uniref:maleylpyruvate isomerase N-terminal domain-containing protein n=1 Tax=Dehalogenimonas alkenigignens TaxID=1217799 RepID=UPI0007EFE48C|nr:maleylpyruvate isomerase N-terminal domain-containing protein [Dehalogenimonas alkenigignens]